MKKEMLGFFSVVLFLGLSSVGFSKDTNDTKPKYTIDDKATMNDTDARNAVMALNHMHASLNKIVIYNDKIILEDEYNNIINNLNLTVIKDREIVDVITSIMDTLTAFRLSEMDKEQFQKEYEHQLDNSLTDALSGISVSGLNPIQMASSLVISVGSSYMSYQSQQSNLKMGLDKKNWKLKKDEISELNDIRKDFLLTYWQIMKKYHMPDKWRITERQFTRFVNILKDTDNNKKQRQLLRMEKEMSVFPTYWYELSIVGHHNKDKKVELYAMRKYEELDDELLRHNSQYSLMLANKITYYDFKNEKSKITELLVKIAEVDALNPERKLFSAMQYQLIGDSKKSERLLNENIDDDFLPVLSKRLKAQLYLKDNRTDLYKDMISDLLKQQNLSATDYLYYLGEKPLPLIVKELEKEIKKINIIISKNLYGDDDLIITLPKKWVYRDIDNTDLIVSTNEKDYKFTEISKADDYIVYEYENIIELDKVLNEDIKNIELKLIHNDLPVVIKYDIKVDKSTYSKDDNKSGWSSVIYDAYDKSKKVYEDLNKKVEFSAVSITTRDQCFDVKNSLKYCK
ncbi:MAG: hypothetical protein GQ531_03130 [Sulfurovum sp.]|nr:hypothetical protein [Sulfurovum sp.]